MASKSKKGQDPDYDGGKRKRGGRTCRRDSYAPKKPMSAFFWFIEEERPVVKAKYPDYNGCQMAKKLGESWMTCPNKSKFEALAEKDRERYEAELAEYIRTQNSSEAIAKKALAKAGKAAPATRRGSKSKPPAKKTTVDEDGDDDDEEEIEEEEEVKEEKESD